VEPDVYGAGFTDRLLGRRERDGMTPWAPTRDVARTRLEYVLPGTGDAYAQWRNHE